MATKLIHCKTYSTFNSKKLSALVENTSYTVGVGGGITKGTPEINYLDIVFIQDTAQIWTHGKLYENTTYSFSGGTNSFSVTPHNGSQSGNSTTVQITPSIANASSAASGLMSKTTAEALSSYSSYTCLYNVDGQVTQGIDKVNVHWTQNCDYIDYSKNDFTENIESHLVDFDIPAATTAKAGVMSAADKTKLDGIATGANKYTLPSATPSRVGGVRIGSNISVSSGTISLTKANVTAALGYTPPTTNTTYGLANLESNGLMSATTFTTMAEDSAISGLDNISFETDSHDSGVHVYATQGVVYTNYATGESEHLESGVVGTIDIPAATTAKAGVMSAADKTKLDSIESGADSIVISKTTTGGETTASFTVNGGTATTFNIYGITDTYNPTSASSTYSLSQLGAKNLYNAVLPKAGGDMNSGARISASGGSLYLGNANNSGWLYLQDCASLKNDATNTYWYIKNDGNSLFQTADIKTTLTLNNNTGGYNGIIFKFGDAVGTHIYQTCDASNYYSLVFDGNVFIGGEGKGNLNVNGKLQALGEKFQVLSDGAYWRSDKRSKDNISNARNLNIDSLIREFDWKDTGNHSWGFIAQELKEILPEAVNYDELIDRYSVNYDVAHSAAIASLSAKIELLESRIKELENGKISNK